MATFRAKARAVDLLGKGQIADLPTAISELWKNGYDAYADNLSAKFYQKSDQVEKPFFVISDDGKGMSRDDILSKWVVLGTDSKTRNEQDMVGYETLYKPVRVKMGEKGIGRLSVAYLGSPMLMLTKKRDSALQALFMDWRVLENYNLYLEDVTIPLFSIVSEDDFDSKFKELIETFLRNLDDKAAWSEQEDLKLAISDDIKNIKIPSFFKTDFIKPLIGNNMLSSGTSFFIFGPDEQLIDLAENGNFYNDDKPNVINIRKSLHALFNIFKGDSNEITTEFKIINDEGDIDIISGSDFFTPQDFEKCDHLIDGTFDKNGKFHGNIRIFKKSIEHEFRAVKKQGTSLYGEFAIKLGYIQGLERESTLSADEYKIIEEKLNRFGGLYVYRDGFRVLPYGRQENDFLEFEERRTKRAGTHFFSYRRMFGYIEITRKENKKLIDKAGREGFINNAAYREFVTDLKAFFIDLAKKYFGTDAESDIKRQQQEEIEAAHESAKAEEEKKEKKDRKDFNNTLNNAIKFLPELITQFSELTAQLEVKQAQSTLLFDDIEHLLREIELCKGKIHRLYLKKPLRFQLTENQEIKLFKLQTDVDVFFEKNISDYNKVINSARDKLKEQELHKEFEAKYKYYSNLLKDTFDEFSDKLDVQVKRFRYSINEEMRGVVIKEFDEKYRAVMPSSYDKSEILHSIALLENIFKDLHTKADKSILPFLKHIERLSLDVDEEALTGYFKLRYEEIEKQWQQTKELAQIGVAVEIIDHQFNVLYSRVASSISDLLQYLGHNDSALKIYNSLRNNFEHLEDKYKLMSPLYRTTGKIRKKITGTEIKNYINKFFESQLKESKIDIDSTGAFDIFSIYTYESILYPAIINVVNNALYWLSPVESRKIIFDVIDGKILILNSGLPIEDFYLEKIFELFYSKKVDGRGVGLFLAKETLRSIGMDIYATNDKQFNYLNGACFIIDTETKS